MKRWGLWACALLAVNLIFSSLLLSLFTSGSVLALPEIALLGLTLFIAFVVLSLVLTLARPPATFTKVAGLAVSMSALIPFAAMLSASLYITHENKAHVIEAVFHSLVIMAPILLISGAPIIFLLLILNFTLFEICRRQTVAHSR